MSMVRAEKGKEMTITPEECVQWRKDALTWGTGPAQTECRRIIRLLDALAQMTQERDYILEELLEALAQWDGDWLPHPNDHDPNKRSGCTKGEAIASWLEAARQTTADWQEEK
jgi:hypothetical protein